MHIQARCISVCILYCREQETFPRAAATSNVVPEDPSLPPWVPGTRNEKKKKKRSFPNSGRVLQLYFELWIEVKVSDIKNVSEYLQGSKPCILTLLVTSCACVPWKGIYQTPLPRFFSVFGPFWAILGNCDKFRGGLRIFGTGATNVMNVIRRLSTTIIDITEEHSYWRQIIAFF